MFNDIAMGLSPLSGGAAHNVQWSMAIVSGSDPERHELFDELEAANPRWQREFRTLREAAVKLGLYATFQDFLRTADGQRYLDSMRGVRDWVSVSERNRRQREAELRMAAGAAGGQTDE